MKKYIVIIILVLLCIVTFLYREEIVIFYVDHFIKEEKTVTLDEKNMYYKNVAYSYVQDTDQFEPQRKQDLINIYYTVINSGVKEFTFYCPKEYKSCIDDVIYIANDQTTLSHINNFVHPYNSFKNIETEYDSLGKVRIIIEKTYDDTSKEKINEKVSEILDTVIKDEKDPEKKIKLIHDYIINHSKYDSARSDDQIVKYHSDTAYGTLIEGFGLCGGYTDAMAIFLNIFGIENFKVSSDNHVWNAVKLNNKWLHLDLTWDDPVSKDGKDILEYTFFLITTKELKDENTNQHNFPNNVYKELVS